RASTGVQSFDPAVQAAINRIQPWELVAITFERLREAGIAAINIDLLYGLPRQSVASAIASAEAAAELEPDRLAVFGYAHVP
ncbi:MAG TPA: coproporphyrinogen III oxidase, partial [Oceanicaulis sp.]|nr:coproporphyrinogen III oxidase [Oceanicaulis sp.]